MISQAGVRRRAAPKGGDISQGLRQGNCDTRYILSRPRLFEHSVRLVVTNEWYRPIYTLCIYTSRRAGMFYQCSHARTPFV